MEIKKIFILLLPGVLWLFGCVHTESLQDKMNALMDVDYSGFGNMSLVNRKGVDLVTYQGITYKIKRSRASKKIASIVVACNKDKTVSLTAEEAGHIEQVLKSFDKMDVLALSVDKNGNVLLSLPWHDRCIYYLLRLSSNNTLEDLKKQYYQRYRGNWYRYKECSKRG